MTTDQTRAAWIFGLSLAFASPAFAAEAVQPLTRADCEKAGKAWDDTANVCGESESAVETKKEKKKKKGKRKDQSRLKRSRLKPTLLSQRKSPDWKPCLKLRLGVREAEGSQCLRRRAGATSVTFKRHRDAQTSPVVDQA